MSNCSSTKRTIRRHNLQLQLLIFLLLSQLLLEGAFGKVTLHKTKGQLINLKGHVYQNLVVPRNGITLPRSPFKQHVHLNMPNKMSKTKAGLILNGKHSQIWEMQSIGLPQNPLQVKCKGRKHLLDDIGILSLITAVTASAFGLYTVLVNSMTSNNIGIISGILSIIIWLPSALLTSWNLPASLTTHVGNFLNGLSFINSMYGFMGVLLGTADVMASTIGETVGILSLMLSVVATFPEWLDSIIELLYRVGDRSKLEFYVENYGCGVPSIFKLDWSGTSLYDNINKFLVEQTHSKAVHVHPPPNKYQLLQ